MSLALIQESAKEVRRLAIAGSPLAVGDFRLKKLVAPLEQAGAKVPVFAQVAKAINDVVNGSEAGSAVQLLNLSTLLNAILYTQGQSSAEGDCRELEMFASNCTSTRTPARVLKPLVQALTTTGGGRFEIVKSAAERGAFNDLRLIDPAIQALGDVYPELADLVAEKILPGYGPGIVPRLKSGLDLNGKKPDARRLLVMHRLDPEGALALCKTALEDGSPEVKVAAIACLGQHEDCLPLVVEQTKSKNKVVREAALEAAAVHDRPEIIKLFSDMVRGKIADLATRSLSFVKSRTVFGLVLSEANGALAKALKGDADALARFAHLLQCLRGRKDADTEEFLIATIGQADQITKIKAGKDGTFGGADLIRELAQMLYATGAPRCIAALLAKRDKVPVDAFDAVLCGALRIWPPAQVFDEFSPLLGQKKGAAKVMAEELQRTLSSVQEHGLLIAKTFYGLSPVETAAPPDTRVELDARWLEAAIKVDALELACSLARPGNKGLVTYLLTKLKSKNQTEVGSILAALADCQHPEVTDLFLEQVTRLTKKTGLAYYELHVLLQNARHLPASDLPKLDAFAATLDEKFVDQFLEAIAPLRSAASAPPA